MYSNSAISKYSQFGRVPTFHCLTSFARFAPFYTVKRAIRQSLVCGVVTGKCCFHVFIAIRLGINRYSLSAIEPSGDYILFICCKVLYHRYHWHYCFQTIAGVLWAMSKIDFINLELPPCHSGLDGCEPISKTLNEKLVDIIISNQGMINTL